jgi:predicted nucleic acid-binding Zn ribbon protein
MGDKALSRCTKCRGKVRKVVSRSSFQLKGSGWYLTDYGKSGSSGAKAESKAETKSEAKPAATACGPSGCGNCD